MGTNRKRRANQKKRVLRLQQEVDQLKTAVTSRYFTHIIINTLYINFVDGSSAA
jgi:hypothetical protein